MTADELKHQCNRYVNKTKGYTVEIDNLVEDDRAVYFDALILKKGTFKATQPMSVTKTGHLPHVQLRSQMEKFSAMVENGLL